MTHPTDGQDFDQLFCHISTLIEGSRRQVKTAVNVAMVRTYYGVGHYIVQYEQGGNPRAAYGKEVLKRLSARLTERYGEGWSLETLHKCIKFYNVYSKSVHSVDSFSNVLSWSHYLVLMRVADDVERSFYEIECARQQWSVRQLQRQVGSSLYERLALSRNKEEVMRLANEGQTMEKPDDIIKNPLTLEFLGLKPQAVYTETRLEQAIIDKMQMFLLEMGRFVDLVFYNRLLRCYVLIDLKTDRLSHQDLGQMQMYVNYFDRYVKQDFENPTIGILLCESKNDALVELTLPKDAHIYAQQYALYLPDKTLLQSKLKAWIEEFEEAADQ